MEQISCPVCGEHSALPLLNKHDRFSGVEFTYVCCSTCGLIYLNPRPDPVEILRYYPDRYEAYQPQSAMEKPRHGWRPAGPRQAQFQFVTLHAPQPARLLDVGCGTGDFLDYARRNGWQVAGTELNPQIAELAHSTYGLVVYSGALEEAPLGEAQFDVVTLWDVLEHLPDPCASLRRCQSLLRPGGLLVFSIPNLDSFDRFLFGTAWIGWDAPRHFNLFDRNTLRYLLDRSGFHLVDRRCITGAKGAFFLSLDPLVENTLLRAPYQRLRPALSLALWPYRQIAYLLNRGPVITCAARKV